MVGIKLIVEVLDHAPAELTDRQVRLLLAIAETANDQTRTGWPGIEVLTRRMQRSERIVRKVLAELAAAGYETRVPLGTDRRGRPVYAHRGTCAVYRLPDLRSAAVRQTDVWEPRKAAPRGAAFGDEKGGPSGVRKAVPQGSKGGTAAVPPFPQEPSENPHPRAQADDETAAVIDALRHRTGKTIDQSHAAKVAHQLLGDPGTGSERPGIRDRCRYLAGAIRADPDPARFLPTPSPAPYRRKDHQ